MHAARILCATAQVASKPLARALKRSKASTGIVGVAVHPEPLAKLRQVYQDTLAASASLPSQFVYRQAIEALTQHRLDLVKSAQQESDGATDAEPAIVKLERAADQGNIEQLIDVAEGELRLVQQMTEWGAHEELAQRPNEDQWQYFTVPRGLMLHACQSC